MQKTVDTFTRQLDDAIADGHYAKKQLACKDRLISWSHRSRFEIGLRLARKLAHGRLLDYGCGDGTFVAMLATGLDDKVKEIVGVEVGEDQVSDCQERLGTLPRSVFRRIDQVDTVTEAGKFQTVFCMEVLEHVVQLETVVDRLERLLAADGTLVISVPIETGFPLLIKQAVRRVAGWRNMGDYKYSASYTLSEYRASLLAGPRQHIPRLELGSDSGSPYFDHKGFNWMVLRETLSERFVLEQTISSPISWLTPHFASQAWFVLRKRPA
ncbi:MAG TPA: methyltransferase domain-containing protein [Pyrinomonadaceae bacterium]|nr:methyltransferase domain-containing protein [Pyrinomonadaceae bacterium]